MIITDNAPKTPPKASTPLLSGASGSGVPPPAYAPHAPGPTPIVAAQVPYAVYQPGYPQQREQSAGKRFLKAFLVAFGIWILASALLGSILDEGKFDRTGVYPIPSDVTLEECVTDWSEAGKRFPVFRSFPYSAKTSFKFPLPSETLLVLSQGALSAGNLKVTTSSGVTDARVNVVVYYHTTAVLDKAQVCLIKRNDGEGGLGIFTPTTWWNRQRTDHLYFDVELILPRGSSPPHVNTLSTDVHNFWQDLDTLRGIIDFGDISLKGSNGKIHAKTLDAAKVIVQTSNGAVSLDSVVALSAKVRSSNAAISGDYKVSDGLDLTTSNGAIKVAVGINGSEASPHSLSLTTSNHVINSVINLDTTSGTGGDFKVTAKTSNGRVDMRVASAPLDSVLTFDARTSNSAAAATLPTAYEGSWAVATSNAAVAVHRMENNERDPACKGDADCKGRTRRMETRIASKGQAAGNVYWDKKNANRGSATLRTSNAPVTINI
ncbi:hypothetical protein FB451DRAFT_1208265 [Mycena latifolia]|nr:hypothetical protein FB451DRAFT_1208265 [Mycena latifolia]